MFSQMKFKEAAIAFRVGLLYYSSFPLLPFNPHNLYQNDSIVQYHETMKQLQTQISSLKSSNDKDLEQLLFLLAFQQFFTDQKRVLLQFLQV